MTTYKDIPDLAAITDPTIIDASSVMEISIAGVSYKITKTQLAALFVGLTNPMTTAEDIIKGGASGAPIRAGKGADGTFWGVESGVAGYYTPPSASLGSAVSSLVPSAGVVNIDCSLGDYFDLAASDFGANVTSVTFSNLPASPIGRTLIARIKQDATGGRTFALPASFKPLGGSDTAIQAGANAVTVIALTTFDQGTTWNYAMQAG